VSPVTAFQIAFALGVLLAAAALAGAGFRLVERRTLLALTIPVAAGALAGWAAFALDPSRGLAVAAGGLTVAALAGIMSFALERALARLRRLDLELGLAQDRLHELVAQERDERARELDRVLARARADSVSLLVEQERRIADERRDLLVERERAAGAELAGALAGVQREVDQRLHDWEQDLDRVAESMRARLVELNEHHARMTAEAESRIAADAERLQGESEQQRQAVVRAREEIERLLAETTETARAELEADATARRRGLHELGERLRKRERELSERIEREEAEAIRRIQAAFADAQRRQVDSLERSLSRAASSLTDEAMQQFNAVIRGSREDAARRLNRELERAVAVFLRQGEASLAERAASAPGAAALQRAPGATDVTARALERQREELLQAFEERAGQLEKALHRRLEEMGADAEAERAVLDARLEELSRRVRGSSGVGSSG
jgi:hypothetical protein